MELQLKFFLFNLENFFLTRDPSSRAQMKPKEKILEIKNIINEESPDILMLTELGGLDSLKIFNSTYLDNRFSEFVLPGNSERGIELGFLVKKTSQYNFLHTSHKELEFSFYSKGKLVWTKFSRDISELRILEKDKLKAIILLVHLKSKWDREGNDPGGSFQRSAEVTALVDYYLKLEEEFCDIPIFLTGDFNGDANENSNETEFRSIYQKTKLNSIQALLTCPPEHKLTYFSSLAPTVYAHELDYIFVAPEKIKINKEFSGVYPKTFGSDRIKDLGLRFGELQNWPSDHLPLILSFDFIK
jgi:hypothetical protein